MRLLSHIEKHLFKEIFLEADHFFRKKDTVLKSKS